MLAFGFAVCLLAGSVVFDVKMILQFLIDIKPAVVTDR